MSRVRAAGRPERDRGVVDVSVEMLVGMIAVIFVLLLMFESVAYWHARNVFDEAAAEGVRIAAAFDGSCVAGIAAAAAAVARHAGSWAEGVEVTCTDGATVTVTVAGATPGVLAGSAGLRARVSERAPKER